MDASKILPDVILHLKIIGLLEVDKGRVGWSLTRSTNGKFSMSISHFPTKKDERGSVTQHRSLSVLKLQGQDTAAHGHQNPQKQENTAPVQHLNLNLNSLLVTRQMTLFHQGIRIGEKLVPRTHE